MRRFQKYWQDTSGAVTVDWVVLTAAVVGMLVAGMSAMTDSTVDATGAIYELMANWEVG